MGHMIKQTKTIISAVTLVLLTGLAGISGSAMALTPDGETPANEGVCDVLQTATPGLYGLCVAYCEAQDLDVADPKVPSTKILANYNRKKTTADPDMPCIQPVCPCWTADELVSISAGAPSCTTGTTNIKIQDLAAAATHRAEAETSSGRERCRYIDLNTSPVTSRGFSITPAEAQECYSQIQAACP